MKTSRFTESQIVMSLREHDGGRSAKDICRELGISSATFYQWKRKYGGLEARDLRRLMDLEQENSRLKRLLAVEKMGLERFFSRPSISVIYKSCYSFGYQFGANFPRPKALPGLHLVTGGYKLQFFNFYQLPIQEISISRITKP